MSSSKDTAPAAIVREASSLRIWKQEAQNVSKRISQQCRGTLIEYRELGLRLLSIKAAVKHGEWLPLLDELSIPQQRASDAMIVAEFWTKVPERGSLATFLKAKQANLYLQSDDDEKPSEIQATQEPTEQGAAQSEASVTAPAADQSATSGEQGDQAQAPEGLSAAGPVSTPDVEPDAPDIGDACEEVPEGVKVDPDGRALPAVAAEMFAGATGILEWCGKVDVLMDELKTFQQRPAGKFLPVTIARKQINAGKLMIECHVPHADNAFRCDGPELKGCAGAGCSKCHGLGVVPKPLYGEKPPPKPRPPFRGSR